jgi:hypothetical protein
MVFFSNKLEPPRGDERCKTHAKRARFAGHGMSTARLMHAVDRAVAGARTGIGCRQRLP